MTQNHSIETLRQEDIVWTAFKKFDLDNNGSIDLKELKQVGCGCLSSCWAKAKKYSFHHVWWVDCTPSRVSQLCVPTFRECCERVL